MLHISPPEDGIHVLTLDHGKANTLDIALCRRLTEALDEIREEAKAVVITGTGSCFCAGVDLVSLRDGGPDYVAEFMPALVGAFRAVFDFPGPVVAAINGHAIAGGCVIACGADLRIMNSSAGRIGMAELAVGVPLPAAAVEIVRFACAGERLQEILYLARSLPPSDALAQGLVDTLEDRDHLLHAARENAAALARVPRLTFQLTKHRLRQAVIAELDGPDCRAYDQTVTEAWQSGQILSAIDRYVNATLGR